MDTKDRFPLLRKILGTIGLPAEAVEDIIERILDWLSTKDQPATGAPAYPFRLRDDFLSPAELSFYQVLRSVTGAQVNACAKVSLGDLFFAETGDPRKNRSAANGIDRKHVDFLLCEAATMRPMLGIELDDRSHDRPERRARDELVDGVFAAAGLPLLRVPARQAYAPAELVALIQPFFGAPTPDVATPHNVEAPSADAEPTCPKCGAKMALRTAKSGANAGGQFWGCTNFPRCRTSVPVKP
jgi:hypothetical protein